MDKRRISELKEFYHKHLMQDVVDFWVKSDLIDKEHGGFITSVDRFGKSYNDDKSVWFQGRCLWTFSKLCNVYGARDEWAKAADSGAEFIKKHCIDTDGRMFFTVTKDGRDIRKRRYFFSESFLVVGFAEFLRGAEQICPFGILDHPLSYDIFIPGNIRKVALVGHAPAGKEGHIGIEGSNGPASLLPHKHQTAIDQCAASGKGGDPVLGQLGKGLHAVCDHRQISL